VESLAAALHVGRTEVLFWISAGWLSAIISERGNRKAYAITPEALSHPYKHHHLDVLKRGVANQALFEAYFQYCFVPKHTTGEQLLTVRRDKKERKAFETSRKPGATIMEEEDDEIEDDEIFLERPA